MIVAVFGRIIKPNKYNPKQDLPVIRIFGKILTTRYIGNGIWFNPLNSHVHSINPFRWRIDLKPGEPLHDAGIPIYVN